MPRAERLLDAARSGDFFKAPTDEAFALDCIVTGLADPALSPLALSGLEDRARWQCATEHLIEVLPSLLDGELDSYGALWKPRLERLRADRAVVERATRDDLVHLDWAIITAAQGPTPQVFDPGRHALFGPNGPDRVLTIGPGASGTTYRLILSTRSWFDLVSVEPLARPDLAALAIRLNELEGTSPRDDHAWRAQAMTGASPELWFGTPEHAAYSEHAPTLRPSRLEPTAVRGTIADALRMSLTLPD